MSRLFVRGRKAIRFVHSVAPVTPYTDTEARPLGLPEDEVPVYTADRLPWSPGSFDAPWINDPDVPGGHRWCPQDAEDEITAWNEVLGR